MKILKVTKRLADVFVGEGWENHVRMRKSVGKKWHYVSGNFSLSKSKIVHKGLQDVRT